MAINYYHSEQFIHFDGEPAVYAGYYVTGAESVEVMNFIGVASRDGYERELSDKLGRDDVHDIAAAGAVAFGSQDDHDWGIELLSKEFDDAGLIYDAVAHIVEEAHERWTKVPE